MRVYLKILFAICLTWPLTSVSCGASPLCLAGCVRADVKGIKELSESLKEWARLLPSLNEKFHEGVRDDVREMDRVASKLIDNLDRTYGKSLDLTEQTVKKLMAEATAQIDEIGKRALNNYKLALFTTECSVESVSEIIKGKIEESIPRFQWIRSLFGEKFNVLGSTDFQGNKIEVNFDPDSPTDRFQAAYKLMTLKLNSMTSDTVLASPLAIALDRQRLAYSYYCVTRGSVGSPDGISHIYNALQKARQEYLALSRLES